MASNYKENYRLLATFPSIQAYYYTFKNVRFPSITLSTESMLNIVKSSIIT